MVKKRGLGRSLDALLVGSLSEVAESVKQTDQLCQLSVELMQRGKYQPRRGMDPVALDELAESIRKQGVIQPIVVRKLLGGRYEIVAGERRWRAAQLAGLTEVPAIIREIPDEAAIAIALIENIQRESLNPIEESLALQRLIDEFSMTHAEIASAVGKSRATVTNLLRLLALAEDVKMMLENGDLEMGHARTLLTLSEVMQLETARVIVDKGLSVRETEQFVRRLRSPDLPFTPKHVDPDIKRLQQDLMNKLHLKVAVHCNARGKGKVVIRYSNMIELEKLLAYFK